MSLNISFAHADEFQSVLPSFYQCLSSEEAAVILWDTMMEAMEANEP